MDYDKEDEAFELVEAARLGTELPNNTIAAAASWQFTRSWDQYLAEHGRPTSHSNASKYATDVVGKYVDDTIDDKMLLNDPEIIKSIASARTEAKLAQEEFLE